MTLRAPTLLLTLGLAYLAGCLPQSAHVPIVASSQAVAGAANLAVQLRPGLAVQTVGMTFADIATVAVTLKDGANAPVSSPGLTNPITITLPATTGSFTGVPPGAGYRISVVAYDAVGAIISSSSTHSNTVDVDGGVANYSDGNPLSANVVLLGATSSNDTSSSSITPVAVPSPGFDQFKWMLVNNRAKSTASSSMQATGAAIALSDVQPGATTGATHELWAFSGISDAPKKALPVQRFAAPANAAGTLVNPFNVTMTPVNLTTLSTDGVFPADGLPLLADDSANLYYVNSGNKVIKRASSGYAVTELFTPAAAPTGFAVDGSGNVYYTTGTDILMRQAPLYDTDTTVVSAAGVTRIALDGFKNLYWIDGASQIGYAQRFGTTYQKVTIQGGAEFNVGTARMLAADAYGHVYYSDGTNIMRLARSDYGFWDGSPVPCCGPPLRPTLSTVVTANDITGFAVDRAGDIYFTQNNSNELMLVPRGGPSGDHYIVAGSGTTLIPGTTNLAGDPLTTANFRAPLLPAVSSTGVLFCTSVGDDDISHFLRRIAP